MRTTDILNKTVKHLSDPGSYQALFHNHRDGDPFPSVSELQQIIELTRSILFPGYFGASQVNSGNMSFHMGIALEELGNKLSRQIAAGLCFGGDQVTDMTKAGKELAWKFIEKLPELREILATDVRATYNGDPAASNIGEIICCYPDIKAITNYRIAHELLLLGVPIIPRMITEQAHSETGIDIHPAATIGSYFCIDHGTGVVIGATSIIGNNVKLYQGVTLGAKSFPLDENGNPIKGIARHPIIEDDVIIYSNSSILGRITIGKGAVIGGNIWITEDIPAGTKVVQKK